MLVIGHRGAPAEAPENTLTSFDAAIDAGADGIETDLRLTADGVIVLSHDDLLAHGGRVSEMTAAALREAGDIPTLDAFLARYAGRTRLFLECKGIFEPGRFASAEPVARALVAALDGVPDVVVSSFDPLAVAAVRAAVPDVPVGLGCAEMFAPHAIIDAAAGAGYEQVHPAGSVVDRNVAVHAVRSAIELVVWTVNDPERAAELAGYGVAGVFSDDPRRLRAAGV